MENTNFKKQFTEEVDALILDPKHPGIHDREYVERRHMFFNTSREWRLAKKGAPRVEYTPEEQGIWQHITRKLEPLHKKWACDMYLKGKDALGFSTESIPQLCDLSDSLQEITGFQIQTAEGLIPFREFFQYLENGEMLSTQYLRHHANPEYTPEPDMIHDLIGHIPFLANKDYADFVRMIGAASANATDEQLEGFNRLYWFTIEFSLIEELGELKVFGAGLLSSLGEMEYCFSDEVTRLPLDVFDVVKRDYDPTQMQNVLYVIPSFEELVEQTKKLIAHYGLNE